MQRLVLGLALAGAVAMLPLVMRAQGQAPAQQPPAPRPTTADPYAGNAAPGDHITCE